MRYLNRALILSLALILLACSSGKPSPTATPLTPTSPPELTPTATRLPASTVTPTPTVQRPAQPQIGLNFIRFYWSDNRKIALNTTTPYLQPDWIFQDFRELGIHAFRQFVKADLLWNVVEPQDNQWNWQAADVVLQNPEFEPIVTLFALQYASPTPPWATNPAQFQKKMGKEATDYVETVVKRYAPYVKYWELGNEMDHWRAANPGEKAPAQDKLPASFPKDGYSPREQGVFLAQAAAIIRQYDPDAVILMPGMSGLDDYCINTWLPGVIEGGGSKWFDIVNYHYYSSWEQYSLLRPQLSDVLKKLGLADRPAWLTETGSTASVTLMTRTNYPNSPESQAADIFRLMIQAYGYGDALVMWHTYIGDDSPSSDWRMYGIRSAQAAERPAYYAFKLLVAELIPFQSVEPVFSSALGKNVFKITTKAGAVKYVAWGEGGYTTPSGVTQMTPVVPNKDSSYDWQAVKAGKAMTLSPIPVLLK